MIVAALFNSSIRTCQCNERQSLGSAPTPCGLEFTLKSVGVGEKIYEKRLGGSDDSASSAFGLRNGREDKNTHHGGMGKDNAVALVYK